MLLMLRALVQLSFPTFVVLDSPLLMLKPRALVMLVLWLRAPLSLLLSPVALRLLGYALLAELTQRQAQRPVTLKLVGRALPVKLPHTEGQR